MKTFDPVLHVDNSQLILDRGEWPNFHDAELHTLNIWRGDVRPEDDVWTGPVIEVSFELCALQYPYIVVLKFHDCEDISMQQFDHQNAVFDLGFEFEDRGTNNHGEPLTPSISVCFEQAFGAALAFKCFRVEAVARREPDGGVLTAMLSSLLPELIAGDYAFCAVPESHPVDYAALSPLASFREREGLTLVLDVSAADAAGLAYDSVFRCISLGLESSLDAVGLTAAVAGRLAEHGISANVIAAYHHDHIFVPANRADDALTVLSAFGPQA